MKRKKTNQQIEDSIRRSEWAVMLGCAVPLFVLAVIIWAGFAWDVFSYNERTNPRPGPPPLKLVPKQW